MWSSQTVECDLSAAPGDTRAVADISQPGEPVLVPMRPEAVAALMQDLTRIDDLWKRLDVAVTTPAATGSPAEMDVAEKERVFAYDLAVTGLRAALDHLVTWRSVLAAGLMPTYAHMSLIRTAHESALLAFWLMDRGLDPDVRRARGIAAQVADYDERRKFEDAAGRTSVDPPGKLAVERLASLMTVAGQLGLTQLDKKGKIVLKTTVPGTVELFDLYEPVPPAAKPQFLYRLYSGYAHAKQWAMVIGAQRMTAYDASGRSLALSQSHDLITVGSTLRCVNAVDRAISAYEQLRK
jgi:hypothetical protein